MKCKKCKGIPVKNGRIKSSGKQRFYCKTCNESFVEYYDRKAFRHRTDGKLIKLIKEGNGIRGIGRCLEISPKTVIESEEKSFEKKRKILSFRFK